MKTVPITASEPWLEGVLGPLTDQQDATIRAALLEMGDRLTDVAARLGGRVGWHNTGVELHWMPSGQQSLWCAVEAMDGDKHAVAFIAELRPGWYYGERTGRPEWIAELTVEVDCLHDSDHGSMHEVHGQSESASTADDAVAAYARSIEALEILAGEPVASWTSMGADG